MGLGIDIPKLLGFFLAMVFALSFHEFAHALAARMRGDTTARDMGRMTINPMAHLDWIGTVLLPLIGAIMHWPMIGWAKPVPVDPRRFKNPRVDHAIVAFAGPLANVILGFFCAVAIMIHERFLSTAVPPGSFFYPLVGLMAMMLQLNGVLAIFNMIPLPPLDGSAILMLILPESWARRFEEVVAPYGFMILLLFVGTGSLAWLGELAGIYVHVVAKVAAIMVFGTA